MNLYKYGIYLSKSIILILIGMVMIFSFKGEKNIEVDFNTIWDKMTANVDLSNVEEKENQDIKYFLSLDPGAYDQIRYYKALDTMAADEIIMVKFRNNSDARAFEDTIDAHKQAQIDLFGGYAPLEEQKLKDGILYIQANYAIFIVHDDAQTMFTQFKNAIGG